MSVSFQTGAEPVPGYILMDRLGSGGFGEVWKCEAPGGIFKAIKVIHGDLRQKDNDAYRFAEQELKALKRVKMVRHPYLLALDRYDIVDGRLLIVMELADRNLWERFRECRNEGLPGIPRLELMQYMTETAEVLDLMYDKHQLQHLDIKPQNLFLLYNHVKVADFGQVKDLEGLMASVTGGITPVYAAPETFDGFVSRYCDQYSLACVYQELLTGVRPFDGNSMQQLLMQHLQAAPNLQPSPIVDRPALARALSKKPDDRFPSVMAMVQALGDDELVRVPRASGVLKTVNRSGGAPISYNGSTSVGLLERTGSSGMISIDSPKTGSSNNIDLPRTGSSGTQLPMDHSGYYRATGSAIEPVPLERSAQPERKGAGSLRPALVVGLGYSGLRVVQFLRKRLQNQYGSLDELPALKMVCIDTEGDTIDSASKESDDPLIAALPVEDIIAAKLNRSAHYLKPVNNGRAVFEGWFDPQLLHRMPRIPGTMGQRSMGRLALADHYRSIVQKLNAELDAILDPSALHITGETTHEDLRTNRPRVYIVAGSGGGTGSGMFIDVAYLMRARLKRIGINNPDVVGILLTPPDIATTRNSTQSMANTFAALTELNHFSNVETQYLANFEGGFGVIKDNDPPFSRVVVLPGYTYSQDGTLHGGIPASNPIKSGVTVFPRPSSSGRRGGSTVAIGPTHTRQDSSNDPALAVSDYLRLELYSELGRCTEEARKAPANKSATTIDTFGLTRYSWPRYPLIDRAANIFAPVLFSQWLRTDQKPADGLCFKRSDQEFQSLGLDYDSISRNFRETINAMVGGPIDAIISRIVEPFAPKGWLARSPEPSKISDALTELTALLGPPRTTKDKQGKLEAVTIKAAEKLMSQQLEALSTLTHSMIDSHDYRITGAQETLRILHNAIGKTRQQFAKDLELGEAVASGAFDRIGFYAFPQKGSRKPSATEVHEVIQNYPTQWLKVVIARQGLQVCDKLRENLSIRVNDLGESRKRAEEIWKLLVARSDVSATPASSNELLPVGCVTTEAAAQRFLKALTDDDLNELEQRYHKLVNEEFGGIAEACLNSSNRSDDLVKLTFRITRQYLDERLGEADLAGMFVQKYGSGATATKSLGRAFEESEPKLVRGGMFEQNQVTVFASPTGKGSDAIVRWVAPLLPDHVLHFPLPDEVVFYREYHHVPLPALPQLGPVWSNAYKQAPEASQTSPHVRLDITQWLDVDG